MSAAGGVTAILSALAEEQQGLAGGLHNPVCTRHAGRDYWSGLLYGKPVVLALSRIGKVAAATTAAALIEKFGVARVVFTGVAGGVGPGVCVGDVVLGSAFIQHDMDASPLFPRFEIPLYGQTCFPGDTALTALLLQASQAAMSRIGPNPLVPGQPVVHMGLIASGDRFVSGADEVERLVAALQANGHQPLAVEMEGAAVAQVCADYGVPFAAVRTISDRADDTAHVDFPRFIADVASVYARDIMTEFLQAL
ncbi:MAG: 5'-methylthioadenosine/adenosylhomocysteine nucleosidase [Pseudomonadota bacterium]